jgi:hypothetical protein
LSQLGSSSKVRQTPHLEKQTVEKVEDLPVELRLTVGEVNLLLGALSELPFKVSFGLIQKVRQQAEQQVNAAQGNQVPPEMNAVHT